MSLEFLKEHRGEIGPIKKACGLMKASKSGFYEHLGRKKSNAQIERETLGGFVVEAFERHKGRYGYRRINRELRKSGIVVSEKRDPETPHPEEGRARRPSAEPGGARLRRGRAQQALGGRHHLHTHKRGGGPISRP